MDPFFEKYTFLRHLQRAYDRAHGNSRPVPQNTTRSKKRGRSEWEEETNDELFSEIYQILVNEDSFPTFKTLLMYKFHQLVAASEQNQYYQQVLNIIVDFRFMMAQAEQLFLDPMRQYDFYFFVVDDLNMLLQRSKHPILLFHLSQASS